MSDMSEKTPRYDVSRIGDNIASMRRNAGLTQEGLAFQLGISAQAVSKWERGVACPDMTLLPRLAVLFDVRIDALFLDGENPDGTLAIDRQCLCCHHCIAEGVCRDCRSNRNRYA